MKYPYLVPIGILSSIFAVATPSLAGSFFERNSSTGSSSMNRVNINASETIVDQTTTRINNTETFTFDLQTGNNRADANTGDGTAESGSIATTLTASNQSTPAPTTSIVSHAVSSTGGGSIVGQGAVMVTDDPVVISGENAKTGANSTNTTDVTKSTEISVHKTVTQTETTDLNFTLRTGHNEADFNTGNGTVISGNISVLVKKETVPPLQPQPAPSQPVAPGVAAQPSPAAPTPTQEVIKPILAEKIAQLIPSQPTQLAITPAAQPAQAPVTPAAAPEKKLPTAGAETPLLATLFSAGSLRIGYYLRRRKRELLYRTKKPW